MYLEDQYNEQDSDLTIYTLPESIKCRDNEKYVEFVDSFAGVYLFAGREFEKQVSFTVAQALKIEGLLGQDITKNKDLIKLITATIMKDADMRETTALIIDRFGK